MSKPKTLRQALNQIQDMLNEQPYSAELWDVLTGLRGPDTRDRSIKNATTALIRTAAFPKQPCLELSVFAVKDSQKLAARRRSLFATKLDTGHFREHVYDAFVALGLKMEEPNELQAHTRRNHSKVVARGQGRRTRG